MPAPAQTPARTLRSIDPNAGPMAHPSSLQKPLSKFKGSDPRGVYPGPAVLSPPLTLCLSVPPDGNAKWNISSSRGSSSSSRAGSLPPTPILVLSSSPVARGASRSDPNLLMSICTGGSNMPSVGQPPGSPSTSARRSSRPRPSSASSRNGSPISLTPPAAPWYSAPPSPVPSSTSSCPSSHTLPPIDEKSEWTPRSAGRCAWASRPRTHSVASAPARPTYSSVTTTTTTTTTASLATYMATSTQTFAAAAAAAAATGASAPPGTLAPARTLSPAGTRPLAGILPPSGTRTPVLTPASSLSTVAPLPPTPTSPGLPAVPPPSAIDVSAGCDPVPRISLAFALFEVETLRERVAELEGSLQREADNSRRLRGQVREERGRREQAERDAVERERAWQTEVAARQRDWARELEERLDQALGGAAAAARHGGARARGFRTRIEDAFRAVALERDKEHEAYKPKDRGRERERDRERDRARDHDHATVRRRDKSAALTPTPTRQSLAAECAGDRYGAGPAPAAGAPSVAAAERPVRPASAASRSEHSGAAYARHAAPVRDAPREFLPLRGVPPATPLVAKTRGGPRDAWDRTVPARPASAPRLLTDSENDRWV